MNSENSRNRSPLEGPASGPNNGREPSRGGSNMPEDIGKKILICDDDDTMVFLLESLLERQGYTVQTALDGFECLLKFKKDKPDLLLLDLDMPVKNGFEVLDELSTGGGLDSTPVVVISAGERMENKQRLEGYGVKDIFIKPFDADELMERINERVQAMMKADDGD